MAQKTSDLWKTLRRQKNTQREYGFEINGVWYGPDQEVEHCVDLGLYEDFGIGNAATASLSLSLFADDVPRAAEIKRYIRLKNAGQTSEWLPKGVFFTNRRSEDGGCWTIEAFDAMRKADVVWEPNQSLVFPMAMPDAMAEFARIMGVALDPRTVLNRAYAIDYPANEYTVRDELRYIAAAHGGNFIMSDEGRLLLVPLRSAPVETNLLVEEYGDAILFGEVRILV